MKENEGFTGRRRHAVSCKMAVLAPAIAVARFDWSDDCGVPKCALQWEIRDFWPLSFRTTPQLCKPAGLRVRKVTDLRFANQSRTTENVLLGFNLAMTPCRGLSLSR
jgi:hypothetical protein